MANTIKIKRKTTTGAPALAQLEIGEGCIVVPDDALYFKKDAATIIGPFTVGGSGGGGGSITFTTVEKNLGNVPRYQGEFTITGSGFTVGRPVLISQASGPYTGKGTLADEALDMAIVNGYVLNATTIKAFYQVVKSPLKGNIKFNFAIL